MKSGTITLEQFKEDPERFFKEAEDKHITVFEDGAPKRVLIDISEWERFTGKKDTRRAFTTEDELPEEYASLFEGDYLD